MPRAPFRLYNHYLAGALVIVVTLLAVLFSIHLDTRKVAVSLIKENQRLRGELAHRSVDVTGSVFNNRGTSSDSCGPMFLGGYESIPKTMPLMMLDN